MARPIYLVGVKHSGKTQHGDSLAGELGRSFLDLDTLIQYLDEEKNGVRRTVRQIYRKVGVDRFRELEAEACRMAADDEREVVVATGGGVCDNDDATEAYEEIEPGVRGELRGLLNSYVSHVLGRRPKMYGFLSGLR